MQTNKDVADRVFRNNSIVNQAGEKLLSQLQPQKSAIDLWTGMRSRHSSAQSRQEHQVPQQHLVGQGFRDEMAKVTLSVEERTRFEDAYYGYWIGVEGGRREEGGMWYEGYEGVVMRHGDLDLRSLFLRKVMLRARGKS